MGPGSRVDERGLRGWATLAKPLRHRARKFGALSNAASLPSFPRSLSPRRRGAGIHRLSPTTHAPAPDTSIAGVLAVIPAKAGIHESRRICRKLALSPGDRVVEIGSGWGSFAVHAAHRYGCRVTTTTISREQHAFVERLVRERGLADRMQVLCSDYRDLRGTFDKLVSIEMIEAVGHEHLPRYFGVCADLLHERGEALIQAITMPERRYRQYRHQSDFIRRHVFPGSCVPSLGAILAAATGAAGFSPAHLESTCGRARLRPLVTRARESPGWRPCARTETGAAPH